MPKRLIIASIILVSPIVLYAGEALALPWTVDLSLQSTDTSIQPIILTFGWNDEATEGFNSGIDLPSPPSPPQTTFDGYFPATGIFTKLSTDIRKSGGTPVSWNIVTSGTEGKVSWDPADILGISSVEGIRFTIDGADMSQVDRLSFVAGSALTVRIESKSLLHPGDFNSDGRVWTDDFVMFVEKFGLTQDDPIFDAAYDLNNDGRIWTEDFSEFVRLFGTTY